MPAAEIVVAANGAVDDCRPLAAAYGARVIDVAEPGPGVARNRAAAEVSGEVLVFVDADVVAAPDALAGMCRLLECEPEIAGVFGAYGVQPAEANLLSQYRNLSHAYVHEVGDREATTFWAGLGAMRASVFWEVGGFDERFGRPSVEDIDLGYRVRRAGHRLRLDPRFRGEHLKHWTIWSSIATDIFARGIPWTQLILKYRVLANDLNTRHELRWSVVMAYLCVGALLMAIHTSWAVVPALGALLAMVGLNRGHFRWLVGQRGVTFALQVIPVHLFHHLCNGLSFGFGVAIYFGARLGLRLPGAIPLSAWKASPR